MKNLTERIFASDKRSSTYLLRNMQVTASEKVASDLRLGGSFRNVLQFPPSLISGYSLDGRKGDEKKN